VLPRAVSIEAKRETPARMSSRNRPAVWARV